jgi:hypothetical protein
MASPMQVKSVSTQTRKNPETTEKKLPPQRSTHLRRSQRELTHLCFERRIYYQIRQLFQIYAEACSSPGCVFAVVGVTHLYNCSNCWYCTITERIFPGQEILHYIRLPAVDIAQNSNPQWTAGPRTQTATLLMAPTREERTLAFTEEHKELKIPTSRPIQGRLAMGRVLSSR